MKSTKKQARKATKVTFRTILTDSEQPRRSVQEAYSLLASMDEVAKLNMKNIGIARNNWTLNQGFAFLKTMRQTLRKITRSNERIITKANIKKLCAGRIIHLEYDTAQKDWRKNASALLKAEMKIHREDAKQNKFSIRQRLRSGVDMVVTKDIGRQVNIVPGQMLAFAEIKKSQMVCVAKRPMTQEEHTGIELEFLVPAERSIIQLQKALLPFANFIEFKHDGSVKGEGYVGREIAICAPISQYQTVVNGVCRILAEHGCKVNMTCGLHVHVDVRRSTKRLAETVYNNLRLAQGLLLSMQPKSRRDNHYCKKSTAKNFYNAIEADRYKAINAKAYNEHCTIEVRCHSGTIEASKIIRWVEILRSLSDAALIQKPVVTDKALAMVCPDIPCSLVLHAKERRAAFRQPRTKAA